MSSRRQLEERVDELAARHAGSAFAEAVKKLHDELDAEGQAELRDIVLARAADVDQALMARVDARGWFRRQWDRATGEEPRRR